jgi:hypothetical protein
VDHVKRVPGWFLILSLLVLLTGITITLVGAYQIGITWDERTNMRSLQVFFDQGWNITEDALINGEPDPNYLWGIYVYGPVSLLFTHALAVIAGAEDWAQIQYTSQAYAIRHVGGALIGLLGIAAAGLTLRVITGSWRWAVVGAAALASIPLWTGNSMMNIKDGPVATGYTIATLGIVLLMRDDYLTRRSVRFPALAALYVGAFLAAGTRAAAGVPIVGSVFGATIIWWLVQRRTRQAAGSQPHTQSALRRASRRLLEAGAALTATYLTLVLLYPNVWKNPFTLFYQGVVVSAKFPFDEPIMFAGSWVDQPVPWSYLPGWFAAQLPLLIVIAGTFFIVAWLWQAIRTMFQPPSETVATTIVMSTPVVLQAVMLPLIAIVLQATVYNGVRQFLFVVPAAAMAAVLGLWFALTQITKVQASRAWSTAIWIVAALGLIVPTAAQLSLFPYTYAYYNAATAMKPIDGNWPTDYWRASSNELMRKLPAEGPESCAYEQGRNAQIMPCSDQPMFKPYLSERGVDARPGLLEPGQYWLVRENQGSVTIPDGCVIHDGITRQLFWQTVTVGQILRCDADASVPANREARG